MSYILKLKETDKFLNLNSDDDLFLVNKELRDNKVSTLCFTYFSHSYSVDFVKQEITIDGELKSLKLPKNNEESRWIHFRRNFVDLNPDGTQDVRVVYYLGFQVTISEVCHKRMIKIDKDNYELVDKS
jgi:hypothetical protein